MMGKKLNLEVPTLYQEKLQWLKLFDRKPEYTQMVDKILVKEWVTNKIGKQYVIPTLGVWNSFDEIDFNTLPNSFVLKTNNGGGSKGVIVCNNKQFLDKKKAKRILEKSLRLSIFQIHREWPYKDIKPQILAEEFIDDNSPVNKEGLTDYKFTCFNGYADNVMVCTDRQSGDTKFYFFDRNWQLLPLNVRGKNTPSDFKLPKPKCLDEMFNIAGKLSEGIPFLRVDLYCVNDKPLFGECTFFPNSGFDRNILPETEIYFGNKIVLPNKK